MPQTKVHAKSRRHSNLRPKHKHSKEYLKHYWPYIPVLVIIFASILFLVRPGAGKGVLGYATDVTREGLLAKTNQERTVDQDTPLKLNDRLSQAAQAKAEDMVTRNYWSHYTPDGKAPWIFIDATAYRYTKAGENLAYGFKTSEEVLTGWMNSPLHKSNILDGSYKEVGFGIANSPDYIGNGNVTVVVAMYGTPATELAVATSNSNNPLSTSGAAKPQPSSQSINRLQASNSTWGLASNYVIGIMIGGAAMFLILKHGLAIKRWIIKEEQFIVHHPLLDLTLVSLVALGIIISQQVGVIR